MLQALAVPLTILTTARLRVSRSPKVFSSVMRLFFGSHSFPVQAVTEESRSSSELSGLGFAFASRSGTAPGASVLFCVTDIHQIVSESNMRHLDCFFSSPLGLWNLFLHRHANVNNLVDELRLGQLKLASASAGPSGPVFACSCGASFITETVSSKLVSGTGTSMICSTIRPGVSFVCEQPSSLV